MKQAIEWLNEMAETVTGAMFSGVQPPGSEVVALIERIQKDAAGPCPRYTETFKDVLSDIAEWHRPFTIETASAMQAHAEEALRGKPKQVIAAIEKICGHCGHDTTDDGCAYCFSVEAAHAREVCAELLNEIRAYQGEGEFEEGSPTKDHCDLLKSIINYRQRCAAGSDGDCSWPDCPQMRDGEPMKSGRHCPLDTRRIDEED